MLVEDFTTKIGNLNGRKTEKARKRIKYYNFFETSLIVIEIEEKERKYPRR